MDAAAITKQVMLFLILMLDENGWLVINKVVEREKWLQWKLCHMSHTSVFRFQNNFGATLYSVVSSLLLCDGYGYLERLQASKESVALCAWRSHALSDYLANISTIRLRKNEGWRSRDEDAIDAIYFPRLHVPSFYFYDIFGSTKELFCFATRYGMVLWIQ
jgi:hypothetical protein